jgi:hypothetical protein
MRFLLLALCEVRLLIFDPMVPGQRLLLPSVPPTLVETLESHADTLVMAGRHRLQPHSHGVAVAVELISARPDGEADIILKAGRRCELVSVGPDEGSRWIGRFATARWLEDQTPDEDVGTDLRAMTDGFASLVDEWLDLVRCGRRERFPGHIDNVLRDLGDMPDAPDACALWVAGLINPLPAIGVAEEVRPAVLTASSTRQRVRAADWGLRDSIERLR